MLKDCMDKFYGIYDEDKEDYIFEDYYLKEGTYLLVNENGDVEKEFKVTKNNNDKTYDYYDKFAEMDYLSKLIDMNKPIDPSKVIHSNNYLSFFIKKDSIKEKLTEDIIDAYYDILLNPMKKYEKDKNKKKMYKEVEEEFGKVHEEKLQKNKTWIKEHIKNLIREENKEKNYLKIFFEADIEEYRRESKKYVIPNIYNSTQYNINIKGITYGLPNDNMGLNAKKPYLENKSRKNTLPYLISTEEVSKQKKFFDYLMNNANQGKNNVYVSDDKIKCLPKGQFLEEDFNGHFLRIQKGKELEIHDFDNIVGMRFKINNLQVKMVIPIDYSKIKQTLDYGKIENLKELEANINSTFFNKFLSGNYFSKPKDIRLNDFIVKENLLMYREAFFAWFYKGNSSVIEQSFDKLTMCLIKNSISNEYLIKAKEQYNLRSGVLEYFKGVKNMADITMELSNKLRKKINNDTTDKIESDDEYYFAVGQAVSYLISLNKSSKKMHSLINPILNCKSNERLNGEIIRLFQKYDYAIEKRNLRFNNLGTMILGYIPEGKLNENLLISGYLYSNLIYEKSKTENGKGEVEGGKDHE
ncbi:CRISPR-associated protein Csh1 [Clostridium acidisoli DSM 12555]|uniref:CRISPR-associated protein Csh1 n=1 Tax=Clostridium acidisoli DSM 12555 TaxID=1121291 RepID=A0A1W1XM39_9CLOT|nr:type I-B CRISPR-associated protein Cas8b/Csh1 [Clostridium acidisoli]SMC24914.1 CRISPR-associated protein Csh1 [Clostridium acidisoli DSM 12555]